MNVLIVDTETDGFEGEVIEVGAVLYSVDHQSTICQLSFLSSDARLNSAEHINRIPELLLHARRPEMGYAMLDEMILHADYFVAHNAEFDRMKLGWGDHPWLCTCFDFVWPKQTKQGDSLINLALAHGVGVSSAHRALTDCQLIASLFDRMDDLPGMIAHAARPSATFKALVSYSDRELAKSAGFKWQAEDKIWTRRMAREDIYSLPFGVKEIARE